MPTSRGGTSSTARRRRPLRRRRGAPPGRAASRPARSGRGDARRPPARDRAPWSASHWPSFSSSSSTWAGTAASWGAGWSTDCACWWVAGLSRAASCWLRRRPARRAADRRPSGEVTAGVIVLCLSLRARRRGRHLRPVRRHARRARRSSTPYMQGHGGVVGESMWAVLHPVIGAVGVTVLVFVAMVAGLLLVTGSSLGLWASRSRRGVVAAGDAARRSAQRSAQRRAPRGRARVPRERDASRRGGPRAVRAAAPRSASTLIDGARDLPDVFDGRATVRRHAGRAPSRAPRPEPRPDERVEATSPASSCRWPVRPRRPATRPARSPSRRRPSARGVLPDPACCSAPRPARARPRP